MILPACSLTLADCPGVTSLTLTESDSSQRRKKMPKAKAHSGAAKRFKKTANRSHILTKMSQKRKRHLRGTSTMNAADTPAVDRLLRV